MPRTLLTSEHGFAMPAEWSPHAATWMGWPCDDALWLGELELVRREFTELVGAVAAFEPVELLVRDAEAETDATFRLSGANVRLHREIAAAAREEGLSLAADSARAGDGRESASTVA